MLDFLGGIATSIIGGGITGILGVIVQRVADYKNKQLDLELSKQKFEQDVKLRQIDAEIMEKEYAGRNQIAMTEGAAQMDVADSQAFAASFNGPIRYSENVKPNKTQGFMLVLLDFIRGLVRPMLTIYLCLVTTLMYFHARKLMGKEFLKPDQALELMKLIIGTVLYLTTTCILHWFGTRNKQKAPKIF